MSLPLVIGITGRKRSGKSTLARLFAEGDGYVEKSFAEPLKEAALALNPIVEVDPGFLRTPLRLATIVERHGWERAKDEYPEVRRILQRLGTNVVRNMFGENTWIFLAGPWPPIRPTVFADVRFDNEARMIVGSRGRVIKVVRPGLDDGDGHPSEAGISDNLVFATVVNDGTPDDLYLRATRALVGL